MQQPPLPLKDIHLPDAIGWWPPAVGWWLAAVLIPLAIVLLVVLYKRLTRKTAIKTAKKQLASIKRNNQLDERQKLAELSALVRRVAISVSPRAQAAGLTGQAWLAFLDRTTTGSPFSRGIGQLLAEAPYRKTPPNEAEITQLITLCEAWLKTCAKQTQANKKA
ncbi:MAG: DUF4381 domain-containing protein [Methylococcaceae bacterium]